MRKSFSAALAVVLVTTPALADVRPGNCAPVFPLMDKVASVAPLQDVQVAQAGPVAAAKKGFFGLPLLLPLLLGGGAAAAALGGGGGGTVSPA